MSAVESTTASPIPDGLMAMTNDSSQVITLLKRDPEHGAVWRDVGEWKPLLDPRVLGGLAFVGVTDDALDIYDDFASRNKIVTIGHYTPSSDGPFWPYPVVDYTNTPGVVEDIEDVTDTESPAQADEVQGNDSESNDGMTASITLDSVDDLPLAIAAALRNKDLRWYVERRVEALGLDVDLPWVRG